MKKVLMKVSKVVLSLALVAASSSTMYGCFWWLHQPKEPEALSNRD